MRDIIKGSGQGVSSIFRPVLKTAAIVLLTLSPFYTQASGAGSSTVSERPLIQYDENDTATPSEGPAIDEAEPYFTEPGQYGDGSEYYPDEEIQEYNPQGDEFISDDQSPLVEQTDPLVDQPAPLVDMPDPLLDHPAPLVEQSYPLVDQNPPLVEQPAPLVDQPAPLVRQPAPLVNRPAPLVRQSAPLVNQPAPLVRQSAPLVNRPAPLVR